MRMSLASMLGESVMGKLMRKGFIVLAILGCFAVSVNAAIVTVEVTATVNNQSNLDYFNGDISVGDTLTMIYSYDTNTEMEPQFYADAAAYTLETPYLLEIGIKNQTFKSNSYFEIFVEDDRSGRDVYAINSSQALLNGTTTDMGVVISLNLIDYTQTALNSIALPSTLPILDYWSIATIDLISGRDFGIYADVTSIEMVPEPATMLMFGLGGLLIRKRIS